MKVVTLNQNDFNNTCYRLADEMLKTCVPAALIGVRTGGAVVAHYVHVKLQKEKLLVTCFEATASRNSTKVKRKANISKLFSLFPVFVLNILRSFEYYFLKLMMKLQVKQNRNVEFDKSLCNQLARMHEGCVYIIDDAIDSGSTIKNILDKCRSINPALDYKVAVLVVTQKQPEIFPDTYLYKDVLLRFPWSSDFK